MAFSLCMYSVVFFSARKDSSLIELRPYPYGPCNCNYLFTDLISKYSQWSWGVQQMNFAMAQFSPYHLLSFQLSHSFSNEALGTSFKTHWDSWFLLIYFLPCLTICIFILSQFISSFINLLIQKLFIKCLLKIMHFARHRRYGVEEENWKRICS